MPIPKGVVLAPGTLLEGTHKGKKYNAEIVELEGRAYVKVWGIPPIKSGGFEVEGQWYFKTLSGAACGITGLGQNGPNGWVFWNIVGGEKPEIRSSLKEVEEDAKSVDKIVEEEGFVQPPQPIDKPTPIIVKMKEKNQTAEGRTRWWCYRCAKGFDTESSRIPEKCPNGHPNEAVIE